MRRELRLLLRSLLIGVIAGVLPLHAALAGARMFAPAAAVEHLGAPAQTAAPCHEASAAPDAHPGAGAHDTTACTACALCGMPAALAAAWTAPAPAPLRHAFVAKAHQDASDFVGAVPQPPPRPL